MEQSWRLTFTRVSSVKVAHIIERKLFVITLVCKHISRSQQNNYYKCLSEKNVGSPGFTPFTGNFKTVFHVTKNRLNSREVSGMSKSAEVPSYW